MKYYTPDKCKRVSRRLGKAYYSLLNPDNLVERITNYKTLDKLSKMMMMKVATDFPEIVNLFFGRFGRNGTVANFSAFINDHAVYFAKSEASKDKVVKEYFKYNNSFINELLALENKESLGIADTNLLPLLAVKRNNEVVYEKKIDLWLTDTKFLNVIQCEHGRSDYAFLKNESCKVHYISHQEEEVCINEIIYKNRLNELTFVCTYDNILIGNIYFIKVK